MLYHRTWERWLSVRTFARTNIFTDLPFLLLCSPDCREELFLCAHQCCAATANRPCNIARRRHRSCMPYRGRVIERKSVVMGSSVSVCLDTGGRRSIKKKDEKI